MKKVFAILAIAGFMAACNNKSDKKADENKDTSKMETVTPAPDTTKPAADTTKPAAMDTTNHM